MPKEERKGALISLKIDLPFTCSFWRSILLGAVGYAAGVTRDPLNISCRHPGQNHRL